METHPLGGPEYYVVSITTIGKVRIMHELMPPMTGGGPVQVSLAAEERGFEVIEYDLLLTEGMGEEEGGCFVMCGMGKFLSPDQSKDDAAAKCLSSTGAGLVGMEEVAGPTATNLEGMDAQWMRGQEDVMNVISDSTRISVESGITMDSLLMDGTTENNAIVWNEENTREHSTFAHCHPVVFD